MEDRQIVELFWARAALAVPAASEKYGSYCAAIARRILPVEEDAEECVNDTWLQAWNAIPPARPADLRAFLGRIPRNLAFNRYKALQADKRGGGNLPLVLEELAECLSGGDVEQELDALALTRAIESFLENLPAEKRQMFVSRYFYARSNGEIARMLGRREGTVAMALSRLRKQLQTHLKERGFDL